jgi:hypothetical protein
MAAEVGGLALVLAGGCGLLGIDHHFADGVDDFHCFSYLVCQKPNSTVELLPPH